MRKRRLQFGTHSLMLLPLIVASAYSGWALNAQLKLREHLRQLAEAERHRDGIQQLIRDRRAEARYSREALMMRIENAQHRQRINSMRMQQLDPIGTRLGPGDF